MSPCFLDIRLCFLIRFADKDEMCQLNMQQTELDGHICTGLYILYFIRSSLITKLKQNKR